MRHLMADWLLYNNFSISPLKEDLHWERVIRRDEWHRIRSRKAPKELLTKMKEIHDREPEKQNFFSTTDLNTTISILRFENHNLLELFAAHYDAEAMKTVESLQRSFLNVVLVDFLTLWHFRDLASAKSPCERHHSWPEVLDLLPVVAKSIRITNGACIKDPDYDWTKKRDFCDVTLFTSESQCGTGSDSDTGSEHSFGSESCKEKVYHPGSKNRPGSQSCSRSESSTGHCTESDDCIRKERHTGNDHCTESEHPSGSEHHTESEHSTGSEHHTKSEHRTGNEHCTRSDFLTKFCVTIVEGEEIEKIDWIEKFETLGATVEIVDCDSITQPRAPLPSADVQWPGNESDSMKPHNMDHEMSLDGFLQAVQWLTTICASILILSTGKSFLTYKDFENYERRFNVFIAMTIRVIIISVLFQKSFQLLIIFGHLHLLSTFMKELLCFVVEVVVSVLIFFAEGVEMGPSIGANDQMHSDVFVQLLPLSIIVFLLGVTS